MRRFLLCMVITGLALSSLAQNKWKKEGVQIPAPICYGSSHSHQSFIKAPSQYLKRLKSTQEKKSSIIVTYIGFEDEPKQAFQYAVEIWEHLIASPVPIYMTARWTALDEGVLGSCGPYLYFENFEAAPKKNRYYPVALVEKLEAMEITDATVPDLIAQFNSDNDNWYFDTDGQTPDNQYDFVSVVLHEIAHGLGYTGFFYEQDQQGTYGDILPYPGIFDEFVINGSDEQLIDTEIFPNPSAELLQAFTSNNLYFESSTAKQASGTDTYPRLYAPTSFDEGSSIYHLNERTYQVGNANSLMTPFFDQAEAIHDPGPLTLGMLADMGWVYTSIRHQPIEDRELAGPITLEAGIKTDSEIDSTSLIFVYSNDAFANADTLPLSYVQEKDLFALTINDLTEGSYQYYLAVTDTSQRNYYLPGTAPSDYFEFTIGADLIQPVVTHTPVKYMLESELRAEILVTATDNIGIEQVSMTYLINDSETPNTLAIPHQEGDHYQATLQLSGLMDGDSIRYQIIATDSSSNKNQTVLPADGYYTFRVDGLYEAVRAYTNNFNADTRDFISSDFFIGTEPRFNDGALHSPHPYPSPDEDDLTYNLTCLLKYPIVLTDRTKMTFNEVVLVEPGEDGSLFGDDDFWDYVIVEGSLNGTDKWLPLIDGYDSRENTTWLSNYNNFIQGNNSTATGRSNYYIAREINLTDNGSFEKGDTIFIRFRLFSDPYAHGWGWAIDDLSIQDPPTATNEITYSPGELMLYPNPVRTDLFIKGSFKSKADRVKLSLFNSHGQLLNQEELAVNNKQLTHSIQLESLPAGLYFVNFTFENGQLISRKFIKH
ncbi:T9SS type A sorting domain-containing protein [uncultured Sunxiuqinia sp.]|uniref:T9SS type A sorting domain-containing protein n=1 Tax=uncultured Sunxiuqinia sp. TaxID=1573825 RepID=UPI00260B03EA|nr:T9SS type A sorting domain-containing protein [uncultured Sunxiuqinia sp.]